MKGTIMVKDINKATTFLTAEEANKHLPEGKFARVVSYEESVWVIEYNHTETGEAIGYE